MPFVAVRLISDVPANAERNFHAIQNNGAEGIVGTYDGFTFEEKWLAMTIGRDSAGVADVSQVFGLKDVPLLSSDSVNLTYAIGLGVDPASAKAAIDDAERQWKQASSVSQKPDLKSVGVYPNPFTDRLSFRMPEDGKHALVRLIDATGRIVTVRETTTGVIDGLSLPAGVYLLEIEQAGQTYRTQVVKM